MTYRMSERTMTTASRPLAIRVRHRLGREGRAAWVGVRRRLMRPATFTLVGTEYSYFHHRHSDTSVSERAVELPVALAASGRTGRVLEVGNVLGHYAPSPARLVVDKYDLSPGVVNEDIVAFAGGPFDLILSISTVEHIGWDETPRDLGKAVRAVEHMTTLLAPGGEMLVTVPVGYNRFLDDAIVDGRLQPSRTAWMVRMGARHWREGSAPEALDTVYGWPQAGANAVAFLWWG